MAKLSPVVGLILVLALQSIDAAFVDLTYALNNQTVTFPGRVNKFNVEFEGYTDTGIWVASKGFCISEHTATHIDAPYHFHEHGRKLDEIPMEDLIDVPGVVIDMYDKVHKYEDGAVKVIQNYALTREDIMAWEKINGKIPRGALVLVRSGWGSRWPNAVEFQGLEVDPNATPAPKREGDAPSLDFSAKLNSPGFDASAAQYLTTERQIVGVGIDTLSIDVGNTKNFPAHVVFAARGKYMLEMVANLHLLPPKGFRLWAVPMKVDRGTGAPTRVVASIPDSDNL